MNRKYITAPANQLYGRRLNRTMNAAGISANRLNTHSWISKSMINKLRRGEHSPTLDMILSLNAALIEMGAEPVQISVSELPEAMVDPEAVKGKAPAAPAKKVAQPEPQPEPEPEPEPEPQPEPETAKPEGGTMMDRIMANLNG